MHNVHVKLVKLQTVNEKLVGKVFQHELFAKQCSAQIFRGRYRKQTYMAVMNKKAILNRYCQRVNMSIIDIWGYFWKPFLKEYIWDELPMHVLQFGELSTYIVQCGRVFIEPISVSVIMIVRLTDSVIFLYSGNAVRAVWLLTCTCIDIRAWRV